MDAKEILARVKVKDPQPPEGWLVFPLLRQKVGIGLVGWAFGTILGLGLFALVVPIALANNYHLGALAAIITTVLLAILLFIGLGSAWTFIRDCMRLQHADQHMIVITPTDFVKQEGKRILHVPLADVRHVTARGLPPPDRSDASKTTVRNVSGVGDNATAFFFGRNLTSSGHNLFKRRRRTPETLAFVDTRTDSEVLVVQDKSHGDPFLIAANLKQYAAVQRQSIA